MIRALQQWSMSYRERGKYTPVGVTFHWVMAGVVIYQLVTGWAMQRYLVGPAKLDAYQLHSEIGLTLLLLGALRLLWRLIVPGPINDADSQGWRSRVAHAIHFIFYALFTALPLSGWIMWSAIQPSRDLSLAGLVPIPAMPFQDLSPEWQFRVLEAAGDVHVACVILLALLIPAHAIAAIKHHFWDRDDVLKGMLPEVPDTHSHPAGPNYSRPGGPSPDASGGG
ncbi:cytochrome b [Allopontixanthobacter sp.]|uniref:cytochrome b n=1 Tax=Allopontixanthobacter sp. TaxID=2906452 RepID=UPI002AB80EA9|nr:cytochrome b/b6 domain-containing protein [Allopontixanthobacter sp.]MDZ4306569.1 cytochrome b/b6 domain-containing protein [Allopontixanthobacter sp.]